MCEGIAGEVGRMKLEIVRLNESLSSAVSKLRNNLT